MPIDWSAVQKRRVGRVLRACPAESGKCRDAARRIRPIARELDERARVGEIWPVEGVFVLPKRPIGQRWYFHATVEAQAHCVDGLTGVNGSLASSYFEDYWKDPLSLFWKYEEDEGEA